MFHELLLENQTQCSTIYNSFLTENAKQFCITLLQVMKNGCCMSTEYEMTKWEITVNTKIGTPSMRVLALCMVSYERCHPLHVTETWKKKNLLRVAWSGNWNITLKESCFGKEKCYFSSMTMWNNSPKK